MSSEEAERVSLCRFDELAVGVARGFDPCGTGADTILVLRRGDTALAYFNRCPHQGARLEYRKDKFVSADGQHLVCHAHGARFDPGSGICTRGACVGQSLERAPCQLDRGMVWTRIEHRVVK